LHIFWKTLSLSLSLYLRGKNYYIERSASFLSHLLKWLDSSSLLVGICFFLLTALHPVRTDIFHLTTRPNHNYRPQTLRRRYGPRSSPGRRSSSLAVVRFTDVTEPTAQKRPRPPRRTRCQGTTTAVGLATLCSCLAPGCGSFASALPPCCLSTPAIDEGVRLPTGRWTLWQCPRGKRAYLPQKSRTGVSMELWLPHVMCTYREHVQRMYNACQAADV